MQAPSVGPALQSPLSPWDPSLVLEVIIFTGNTAKPATQQLCLAGKLLQTADVSEQCEHSPLSLCSAPHHTPSKQTSKQDAGAKPAALPAEVTLEPALHST